MPPPANLVGDPGEVMAVVVVHPPDRSPDSEKVVIASMQQVTAMHKTICNVYILLVLAWETIVLLVLDGSMLGPARQMKY